MADVELVQTIVVNYRHRQDYLKAAIRLEQQYGSILRRLGISNSPQASPEEKARWNAFKPVLDAYCKGKPLPEADQDLHDALRIIAQMVKQAVELRAYFKAEYDGPLERLAMQLPVYPWAESIRGFGALSLAKIVGEARDLADYPDHSKLWKRMGLAVMPDGTRQRRVTGDAAIEHGFNPSRRSVMFVIGDGLIKQNEHYRGLYQARKEYELANNDGMTRMMAHMRAHRYMEKRFLRDLWQAWRDAEADVWEDVA